MERLKELLGSGKKLVKISRASTLAFFDELTKIHQAGSVG
jgi:hypothetical protein